MRSRSASALVLFKQLNRQAHLCTMPTVCLVRSLCGPADMTGSVPTSLSNLTQLKQLDLEFNFFDGHLTAEQLCPTGSNLTALMLRANNFSGPLNLTRCSSLVVVDLQVRAAVRMVIYIEATTRTCLCPAAHICVLRPRSASWGMLAAQPVQPLCAPACQMDMM